MGWFDEQIRQRKQNDNEVFEDAFKKMAQAATGGKFTAAFNDSSEHSKNAMEEILKYYHVKSREIPENIKDNDGRLEYLMHPYGIMRRTVHLSKGWHKDAAGAMLGREKKDGNIVALIPTGLSGYSYLDADSGKHIHIGRKNEDLFENEAVAFYKPFPVEKLGISGLLRYILDTLHAADILFLMVAAFTVTLLGMAEPRLSNMIFSDVTGSGNMRPLVAITIFMVCISVSTMMITGVKNLMNAKVAIKMNLAVESAAMMRILSLPADFFRQYSSGELSSHVYCISSLCRMIVSTALQAGLAAVFSLVYVIQIFTYAPALVVPSLTVIAVTIIFSLITVRMQKKISGRKRELDAKESGMTYAMISGIQKIKLSGAEKRAFARWGSLYAKSVELTYNPPNFLKIGSVLSAAVSLAGTYAVYYAAIESQIPAADYYAFHVAYGMLSGAFLSLSSIAQDVAKIQPVLDMAKPLLNAEPEISEGKQVITHISGGIELNNVSFGYGGHMPLVLDNLSLKIRPGQYVAVVGATGCGKSTLIRLMLGFEKPQKGAVYYDGKDISTIDLKSLRQKIGVVLQEGKLFQGDIYSNITISAPEPSMEAAWEAAELAGIAEDIRNMPMGMFTMISEGNGGISGGQRQRLMIARAVAPKPRILMFDEATSALDNLSQKKVSESLDRLKCTRIIIAHRLSTIKQCDRILVLDKGKIVEDGTYGELIAANGYFAELVARQLG